MKILSFSRKIQLAIVVLLSGLFLTACKGHHEGRGSMMFDIAAYKLDLDDAQEEKLFAIRDEVQRLRKEARKEKRNHLEQSKALILADSLDQAQVLALFEQHQNTMSEVAPGIIAKVSEFHSTLTLEQKEKVVEMLDHLASKHKGK